jgi:hypothetical protein
MAELYSKNHVKRSKMTPKKETISFLLQYSKSLKVYKTKSGVVEFIIN